MNDNLTDHECSVHKILLFYVTLYYFYFKITQFLVDSPSNLKRLWTYLVVHWRGKTDRHIFMYRILISRDLWIKLRIKFLRWFRWKNGERNLLRGLRSTFANQRVSEKDSSFYWITSRLESYNLTRCKSFNMDISP